MRYPDLFRNALMASHQITVRGEFWLGTTMLAPFDIISGEITADRASSVRRTVQVSIDPATVDVPAMKGKLNPFGTHIRLYRGIRYPNGLLEEYQVFYGRIDQVEEGLQTMSLRASDKGADIVDARFENTTWAGTYGTIGSLTCANCAKALIAEVLPAATVTVETSNNLLVNGDTSWERERSDALDQMCTAIGAEWFADMYGNFHIRPLPAAATPTTTPAWIIDAGDTGVLVERTSVNDRQGVYNHVVVISEPFNGTEPARGFAKDTDSSSPTFYGGPFGKVTGFYTGQQVTSNAEADTLAAQLLQQGLSAIDSVNVECVANPKIMLADVVRVFDGGKSIDAMYFVQSFTLPLDPETLMSMTLFSARTKLSVMEGQSFYVPMPRSIPEGAVWQPTP